MRNRILTLEQILKHARELRDEYGGSECVDIRSASQWLAATCATQLSGDLYAMAGHRVLRNLDRKPRMFEVVDPVYARWTESTEEDTELDRVENYLSSSRPRQVLVSFDRAVRALEEMIEKKK